MRCSRRLGTLVLGAAAVLAAAVPASAGPPLICSEVVLSGAEIAELEKACAAGGKEGSAATVARAISASAVPRFRIEGIRWYFHQDGADPRALLAALDRRVAELGERATLQDRFDAALARIVIDWESDPALGAAALLSEIASETGEPVQLIIAAEALDLVTMESAREPSRWASLLSLAHCRRAAEKLAKPATPEDRECARLLLAHLPHLRGMHSRDAEWMRFLATFEEPATKE